ncbi:TPA: hypothetical protein ACH3X3_010096 [Trebouxia sp. C0006]
MFTHGPSQAAVFDLDNVVLSLALLLAEHKKAKVALRYPSSGTPSLVPLVWYPCTPSLEPKSGTPGLVPLVWYP